MNKNQLNKIISNLQNYVDNKIDKLPTSYEEKLLITVPKESIDKSKADAATEDSPYIIDIPEDSGFNYVDGMFNDADIIIEYNGKTYISYITDTHDGSIICRIILENNLFGFIVQKDNSSNIQLNIVKMDTTNITDIKLYMRKKDLNINDLQIGNSISIGRVGIIGLNSSAIGGRVKASGSYSHAEGNSTEASGSYSHAEGYNTTASYDNSHAEGSGTTASGYISHAEGAGTKASGSYSHAEGNNTKASSDSSHAEGNSTKASGSTSHAEGNSTIASGDTSHAEGHYTKASSEYQHVQGKFNIEDAADKYAHIVGNGKNDITRSNAHTLDWEGNAWYAGQVEGTNLPYNISSKVLATVSANSIRLGSSIIVNNVFIKNNKIYYIEFLGVKKLCNLIISKDHGNEIICSINNYKIRVCNESTNITISTNKINNDINDVTFTDLKIHEEEVKYLDSKYLGTDLMLQNSISLGRVGDIGAGSSAIGYMVEASGNTSHAEGSRTTASGDGSHAEGVSTKALGNYSHTEGAGTTASGIYSHAEGFNTTTSGKYSHAEGNNTIAIGDNSHVQGKYNIEDAANKYAHIVGNGTGNTARSNAHTLDWNGNAWYAGDVQGSNLPYTISSKVLTTIPANDIKLNEEITVNNFSINKDRKYYIEFLGSKKLCNLVIIENSHDEISCIISNYGIQGMIQSSNLMLGIHKMSADDTAIDTFTDLVIYEEEIKCLDNKYLENDLRVQNSISLGRMGDIGTESSAVGMSVEASGMGSHAEGYGTIATGNFSHAEGSFTKASREDAHAEGSNTIASSMYQHVQGKYNIEDTANKYAHIVGNGDYNKRSNAHTLDWKGNGWYAGKLSQEGTPTEAKDLVTKKYVDEKFENINLGPYSIQYNNVNNRLEFIYTPPATE